MQFGWRAARKRLLAVTPVALLTISFGSALAADLEAMPAKAPPPAYLPPPSTWTGFYLGANVGYGWGDGSGTLTTPLGPVPISGSVDGVLGGAQIGYNWQISNWVLGLETDFQGSGIHGTVNSSTLPSAKTETPWFGTIRGRLGYAFDRWLIYGTSGVAYSESKTSGVMPAGLGGAAYSDSAIGWNFIGGGGIEWMFTPRWSAKFEYLYFGTPTKVPTPPGTSSSGNEHLNIIRIGLNYHF